MIINRSLLSSIKKGSFKFLELYSKSPVRNIEKPPHIFVIKAVFLCLSTVGTGVALTIGQMLQTTDNKYAACLFRHPLE